MCAYSHSDHELPPCKCVLWRCSKCPRINLPDQETDDQYPGTGPSICVHIYHLIALCKKRGRLPLTEKKTFRKCKQDNASVQSTKIYTRKEIMMMETNIFDFRTSFYIPEIQKLAFQIPHVQILGMNHCGDYRRISFKRCESFQNVLCRRDYSERVVASFAHPKQSEYYGGDRSMSVDRTALENISAIPQREIKSYTKLCPRHSVFIIFLRMI